MLFLLFQLGPDRYALDAARVAEVLPLVALKEIPGAPPGAAGLFDYRGAPVPAVDVGAMLRGVPARPLLSTRLVLVRYPARDGTERLLGLVVERATETVRLDPASFVPGGLASDGAPCLGPVANDGRGLVQRIEVDRLLSDAVRDALFHEPLPAPLPIL